MSVTQIILATAVLVLTAILALVGFQVFFILKEVRESMRKTNKMLDRTGLFLESVTKPVTSFAEMVSTVKGLTKFLKAWFKEEDDGKKEKKKLLQKELDEEPSHLPVIETKAEEGVIHHQDGEEKQESQASRVRRFFTKGGRKLS